MQKLAFLVVTVLFVSSGVALAVPAEKTIEFNKSPMGVVTLQRLPQQGDVPENEAGNRSDYDARYLRR